MSERVFLADWGRRISLTALSVVGNPAVLEEALQDVAATINKSHQVIPSLRTAGLWTWQEDQTKTN